MKNSIQLFASLLLLLPLLTHAQQFKVAGGNLKVNNSSLVLQDVDFVNDGTFSSTDGNVVMTGTSTNTISGTTSTIFDTLTVNKTSGEVQLAQNISIATHLEMTAGNLDIQTSNVSMADPSTIGSASSSSYVQTSSTGTLSRAVADADVEFPVGNSSYNPAILNNNGGTADFYTLRVRDELLENGTSGNAITDLAVNRTWEVGEQNTGGSNLDVTLAWSPGEEQGAMTGNYSQANYNGSWIVLATGAAGSTFGLNSLASMDNATLGDFAIFDETSPVLIGGICTDNGDFSVPNTISDVQTIRAGGTLTSTQLIEATADVTFTAGTAINLQQGFEVKNGADFHALIATCNFTSLQEVEMRNEMPAIVSEGDLQVEVFPNPFSSETNIKFYLPASNEVQLLISDVNGKILHAKENLEASEGWQQTDFEAGNLPSGVYFLVVRANGQQVIKQIVVQE